MSLLGGMNEALGAVPESEASNLREELSRQSSSHSFSDDARERRRRRMIKTQSRDIPYVTGEDGDLAPGNVVILLLCLTLLLY